VRDLTYVGDTVQGFIKVAESDQSAGQLINVGFGKGITIGKLAETIVKVSGKSAQIIQDPQRIRPDKSEVFELVCDNTKAKEILGWAPQVSLEDGLKRVVDFMQANPDLYKPELYNV
jgi:nucleoside-diphosphate-sugar epimerase